MKRLFTLILGIISLCFISTTLKAQNDTIPPVVLDFQIAFTDNAVTDSVDAVFTFTFSENVELTESYVISTHRYNNEAWEEFGSYTDTEVSIEGNILTISPDHSFWSADRYELVITSGSIQDSAGNLAASIERTFMADDGAPEVIDFNIELTENEQNDSVSAVFTLTYSEDVQLNDEFTIVTHIYEAGNAVEYDSYDESHIAVDGNVVTITPVRMFSLDHRYELIITFGSFSDLAGNFATSYTRIFVPDVIPPEVIDFEVTYTDTEFGDSVSANLVLTYNEDVKLAPTYSFVINRRAVQGWDVYEQLGDTAITVSGSTISLAPQFLFSSSDTYQLVVTAGSVRDLVDNQATSFNEIFLRDTIRPQLLEITPDLSLAVPTNAIFTFIFSENVKLDPNFGFYTYHQSSEAGGYDEYERLDASMATVENNVITFDPSLDMRPGERAQIVLTRGSVLDLAGNPFYFIEGNDTLNSVSIRFWTGEGGITLVDFLPRNDDTLSVIPDELSIVFSDAITLTDTTALTDESLDTLVYLRSNGTDLEYNASYDATAHKITIVPVAELTWGTSYTYGFTDGFLNAAYDSIPASEATFIILESTSTVDDFTIAQINGQGDVSPEPGQVVRITGTVTGIYPNEGFFVQDSVAMYSGIWVEYGNTTEFAVGDGVVVTGTVDTLQGVTAIVAEEATAAQNPLTITPLVYSFGTDSLPMYQHVLVQIINSRATEADENGEWLLYSSDGADSVVISNNMFDFSPLDSSYYNVTGVVTGWDSIYQVEPRMESDILEITGEIIAIAEIHGEDVTSPYLDQEVQIYGTVTAVYTDEGFYVQDENAARGGIWVEYTDTQQLELGNGVIVAGTVQEVGGVTSIVAENVTVTTAPLVVQPIVIDFGTDSIPMYSGVVVQVTEASASEANVDGEWTLFADNGLDSLIVSSLLYAYTPVAENLYDVTGVITFRDSIYRIEPRVEADVVDVTIPTSVDPAPVVEYNVYPNPFGSYLRISNNDRLTRVIVTNITGQRVMDINYPGAEINTSHLISGVYIINMFNERELVKTSRIIKQ